MLDQFSARVDGKTRVRSHCNACGHSTIHVVEAVCEGSWSEEGGHEGAETHRILRCGGCDATKYSVSVWDNEDWDIDENGASYHPSLTKHYPPIEVTPIGHDYHFLVPQKIVRVLEETLAAQGSNSPILATVGLRILIETICDGAKCTTKTLYTKINELEKKGLITSEEKELFHLVRDFGNKGAHLGEAMGAAQIASAISISFHLLDKIYVSPAKQKATLEKAKKSLSATI